MSISRRREGRKQVKDKGNEDLGKAYTIKLLVVKTTYPDCERIGCAAIRSFHFFLLRHEDLLSCFCVADRGW